jgi:hypothetical protein
MVQSDLFEVDKFRNLFAIYEELRPKENIHSFLKCSTKKYIELIRSSFDENGDNYLDVSEQAFLLTSLLVFPTYAAFKFAQKTELDVPLVSVRGVCGRLLVYDEDLTSVSEMMTYAEEPFESKAALAVQLIQMVQDFQEGDANWFLLHTNLVPDKLLVTKHGELMLDDMDDVVIFDKALVGQNQGADLLRAEICNEPCFEKLHHQFIGSDLPDCELVPSLYGEQMYVMLCRNILRVCSDSEGSSNCSGLLKSVPKKDAESVADLVRECIYETSPGGRKQAITELRDILRGYMRFEDQDNGDQNPDNGRDGNGDEDGDGDGEDEDEDKDEEEDEDNEDTRKESDGG